MVCSICGRDYPALEPGDEIEHRTNDYHVLTKKVHSEKGAEHAR